MSLFRQESFFGANQLQGYASPPPQHFVPLPQPSQITARQLRLRQHQFLHDKIIAYAVSLVNLSTALNGKVLLDSFEVKIYGATDEALKLDSYNRGLFSEGICMSFSHIFFVLLKHILATVRELRKSISKKVCTLSFLL